MTATYIYFVRPVGQRGPTKIGCTVLPERRLRELAEWSPSPLEIVATIPGDLRTESSFHTLFRDHHSHHEWFLEAPEICTAVDAIRRGWFDITSLPKGRRLASRTGKPSWPDAKRDIASLSHRFWHAETRAGRAPAEIQGAFDRLYRPVFTSHLTEARRDGDRETVEAWITQHPPASRTRKAAA